MLQSTDEDTLRQESARLIADAVERQCSLPQASDGDLLWQLRDLSLLPCTRSLAQAITLVDELRARHPENIELAALALRVGNLQREAIAVMYRLPKEGAL